MFNRWKKKKEVKSQLEDSSKSIDHSIALAVETKWNTELENTRAKDERLRTRWWMHPYAIGRINQRICGKFVPGPTAGMERLVKASFQERLPLQRGISVGTEPSSGHLGYTLEAQGRRCGSPCDSETVPQKTDSPPIPKR